MAYSRCCQLAGFWLLLVFVLAAASQGQGASASAFAEEIKKAIVEPAGQNQNNSTPPSPAGAGGSKQEKQGKKGCVTTKECHMKRLVCAKKCTLPAHSKCAKKCSRASYPICTTTLLL
jgi:hypothetical protein